MPRGDWACALALAGLTLATRWPYRAGRLPTWDAVQFALAVERYDVVRHQPHPPGYILYVALARLATRVVGDPIVALDALAVLASAVAVLLVYWLGWCLYGRGAAAVAALGLLASPLFWAYGVVALPYAAEAALGTGIAIGAWAMGRGSGRALVVSAILLGLAGGVRQSMLLTLSPLWVGMAWRGFRRPGPLLGGLGLVMLATATWLGPMLWVTGAERYAAASAELYASTVRATTVLGDGGVRNLMGLGEAFLVGLGVFLPVLAWRLRRAPARVLRDDDRAVFFVLWTLPALAVYALVHLGQPGYLLSVLPACYLLVGRTLAPLFRRPRTGGLHRPERARPARLAFAGALAAHVAFFTLAGPVDAPPPGPAPTWTERLTTELRAVYRFRLWSHTASGLGEQQAVIGAYVAAIRGAFDPRDTVLVTELGNPRSYPWFRHVMYYLPEYATYHLRLNAAAPGYLASRELPSMAAVAERRVPLPVTTRRLVWVVDEWDPTAPRPAGLEARALPYGRSLYVLPIRGAAVDHAGYQLVPVTAIARLR
jgi:hypothetical protein